METRPKSLIFKILYVQADLFRFGVTPGQTSSAEPNVNVLDNGTFIAIDRRIKLATAS